MEHSETSMESAPKLWNPNAAALWSLLFTPILGSWLLAKNWKELNQPDRAKKSKLWVSAGFPASVLVHFMFFGRFLWGNVDLVMIFIFIIFNLTWYFFSAKKQMIYIRKNGIDYRKKPWGKPLLIGMAGLVTCYIVLFVVVVGLFLVLDSLENGDIDTSLVVLILILASPVLITLKLAVGLRKKHWFHSLIPVMHSIALIAYFCFIIEQPSNTGDATPGVAVAYLFGLIITHAFFIIPELIFSFHAFIKEYTTSAFLNYAVKSVFIAIGLIILWIGFIILWIFFN